MKLSAIDLVPILEGEGAHEAITHSRDFAVAAEAMGLTRLWLAEHHNAAGLACSSPELLIARLGEATERLRIGAGGIMLPNHAPLKVAESFRLLEAMYPGRIDLGLGRAPGTDPRTAAALRRGVHTDPDAFPAQLDALLDHFASDEVPRPAFHPSIVAIPTVTATPELFVLSSSGFGAEVAARYGLGLAFAQHMNPGDAVSIVQRYRKTFTPSPHRPSPYAIVSVSVVCADTRAEAEHLRLSGELAMLRFSQGRRDLPFPTPETAAAHAWTDEQQNLRALFREAPVVGDVDEVASRLSRLAAESGADELMLLTLVHDQVARRRSYERLAETLL